jgi:hypothetical protein
VTVRLLFPFLVASLVAFLAAALALRSRLPVVDPVPVLVYAPFLVGAGAFAVALLLRRGLPPSQGEAGADEWWRRNAMRAVLIWALLEGPSTLGVAVYLISGLYLPLVVTGVGLLLFSLTTPARLSQG